MELFDNVQLSLMTRAKMVRRCWRIPVTPPIRVIDVIGSPQLPESFLFSPSFPDKTIVSPTSKLRGIR